MSGHPYPPEVRDRILETLRKEVPFLALAAEANGVNRKTMESWLALGKAGDERYAAFAVEAYAIRAKFMFELMQNLLSTNRDTAERARQTAWLLMRLDRTLFDPPKELPILAPARTSPDQHATNPTAADPVLVAQAVIDLSQSLTAH